MPALHPRSGELFPRPFRLPGWLITPSLKYNRHQVHVQAILQTFSPLKLLLATRAPHHSPEVSFAFAPSKVSNRLGTLHRTDFDYSADEAYVLYSASMTDITTVRILPTVHALLTMSHSELHDGLSSYLHIAMVVGWAFAAACAPLDSGPSFNHN